MTGASEPPAGGSLRLIVAAAAIGIVAAAAGAVLLWLIELGQEALFEHLPAAFGLSVTPWWWAIPMLLIGATVVVLAQRLPGGTGSGALSGFHFDTPARTALVALLACLGTLVFGFALGPEAALILAGTALGSLAARGREPRLQRAFMLLGGVAAIGTVFGNPFVTAFMLLEIAAFGALPAVMLVPALVALASGYLVQIGVWAIPGIGTHGLAVPGLPTYSTIGIGDFVGALGVATVAALLTLAALRLGRYADVLWHRHRTGAVYGGAMVTIAAVALAAAFGVDAGLVLFSGNTAMAPLLAQTSITAVVVVLATKTLAYGVALGAGFRGGPVFPATYLGVGVAVLAALAIPALALSGMAAAGIAGACAAVLRLPATSALLAFLLVGGAGASVTPLAILGAVVGAGLRVAVDRRAERKVAQA